MGNCDTYFTVKHKEIESLPEVEKKRINYYKSLLSNDQKEYLQSLPYSYEFYMSGSLIRLFHAIYGHIHHCYADILYNKTIKNVGSVGNSYNVIRNDKKNSSVEEVTKAYYVIIEGTLDSKEYDSAFSYQFVRVPYNMEKIEGNFRRIGVDINF